MKGSARLKLPNPIRCFGSRRIPTDGNRPVASIHFTLRLTPLVSDPSIATRCNLLIDYRRRSAPSGDSRPSSAIPTWIRRHAILCEQGQCVFLALLLPSLGRHWSRPDKERTRVVDTPFGPRVLRSANRTIRILVVNEWLVLNGRIISVVKNFYNRNRFTCVR
jgi:hypothetical protein